MTDRMTPLVGKTVLVGVSEPWGFVTCHGEGPFEATVRASGSDYWVRLYENQQKPALLLQLAVPFILDNHPHEYLIASARHKSDHMEWLIRNTTVVCSFTAIPNEKASDVDPFDLSWWRGGPGLIGSLKVK